MAQNESITAQELTFTAVYEAAEEGGFVVSFPAFPDLMTEGATLEEAREMAADCLRCTLEALAKEGAELPGGEPGSIAPFAEQVKVQIKAV